MKQNFQNNPNLQDETKEQDQKQSEIIEKFTVDQRFNAPVSVWLSGSGVGKLLHNRRVYGILFPHKKESNLSRLLITHPIVETSTRSVTNAANHAFYILRGKPGSVSGWLYWFTRYSNILIQDAIKFEGGIDAAPPCAKVLNSQSYTQISISHTLKSPFTQDTKNNYHNIRILSLIAYNDETCANRTARSINIQSCRARKRDIVRLCVDGNTLDFRKACRVAVRIAAHPLELRVLNQNGVEQCEPIRNSGSNHIRRLIVCEGKIVHLFKNLFNPDI